MLCFALILVSSLTLVGAFVNLGLVSNCGAARTDSGDSSQSCRSSSPRGFRQLFMGAEEPRSDSTTADPKTSSIPLMLEIVGKSTSTLVSGTFFVVLAWKRDALMVSMFVGSIGNAILSKVLKKLINQTRPPDLDKSNMQVKPSDGGMPSSHAMSLGFIGTFTALNLPWAQPYLLAYSLVSLYYRVEAKLHTWEQVVVGFLLGSTNGYLWYTYALAPFTSLLRSYILNDKGVLPTQLLVIPVIVGLLVVGSVERRIAGFLEQRKNA